MYGIPAESKLNICLGNHRNVDIEYKYPIIFESCKLYNLNIRSNSIKYYSNSILDTKINEKKVYDSINFYPQKIKSV